MSNLIVDSKLSDSKDCHALTLKPIFEKIPTRIAQLGKGITIRRALPNRERRMIGAWCFFDHFGPLSLSDEGLNIAPHPHIGLQTFTWTIAGEILHRDSLGSEQIIQPGAVNLMTAGRGISHSEESLPNGTLHGVQLWIALPETVRNIAPDFIHYPKMPVHEEKGLVTTILVGELFNMRAPTKVYSPLMALELYALRDTTLTLPVNPQFEHGVLALTGNVTVEDQNIETGTLLYLGCARQNLLLSVPQGARVFILGGEPFHEEILLWWNFVARTRDEIIQATEDWKNHSRFGEVSAYQGGRLDAPDVPWIK